MSSGPRSRGPNGPEAGLAWGLHALESLAHRLLWEPTLFSHGVSPSVDQRRSSRVTCRRQHRNCLQLKVRHQRAIRRFPKHLFSRLRYRLKPQHLQVQSPITEDPKRKKPDHIIFYKWPQPTECRSWKISFKSKVSRSSQCPRTAYAMG